jgi:hypothetical protein
MERTADGRPQEVGRVYVYLQHPAGMEPTPTLTLTGHDEFGRFGSSLTPLGDLDQDGYNGKHCGLREIRMSWRPGSGGIWEWGLSAKISGHLPHAFPRRSVNINLTMWVLGFEKIKTQGLTNEKKIGSQIQGVMAEIWPLDSWPADGCVLYVLQMWPLGLPLVGRPSRE